MRRANILKAQGYARYFYIFCIARARLHSHPILNGFDAASREKLRRNTARTTRPHLHAARVGNERPICRVLHATAAKISLRFVPRDRDASRAIVTRETLKMRRVEWAQSKQ